LVFFSGFLLIACNNQKSHDLAESDIELKIMERGSAFLGKGEYDQAKNVYSQFILKYPEHPYVDDAAYRLAYISVIADDKNPYFDYKNGQILFKNFIENYPNSRYITACQNWVNLLNTVMRLSEEQSAARIGEGSNSTEINRLRNELKRVQAENARLNKTLEELQRAIER
jgi:outer membrane protein assembly factor BamD (BamD/ComL family)